MLLVMCCCQNIYAAGCNMHLFENVEGEKKQPGCTSIEVNNEVHMFVVEDQGHPQIIEIHVELQRLSGLMHDAQHALYEICSAWCRRRRKALSFVSPLWETAYCIWLINTAPGTPIWRRKNLQVCEDCHASTKFISKIVGEQSCEGCQSVSSLWRWCLFVHGLVVMPVICLVNHYIRRLL